jgi:hypothetical protein
VIRARSAPRNSRPSGNSVATRRKVRLVAIASGVFWIALAFGLLWVCARFLSSVLPDWVPVMEAAAIGLFGLRSILIFSSASTKERSLVERATHADYLRELGESLGGSWTDLWRDLFDDAAMKAQLAEASLIDWERPYREALVNEWLPTRLGEATVTVAVKNLASPFTGQKIEALPIPGRWLRGVELPEEPVNALNQQLRIGKQNHTYDRLGIRRLTD